MQSQRTKEENKTNPEPNHLNAPKDHTQTNLGLVREASRIHDALCLLLRLVGQVPHARCDLLRVRQRVLRRVCCVAARARGLERGRGIAEVRDEGSCDLRGAGQSRQCGAFRGVDLRDEGGARAVEALQLTLELHKQRNQTVSRQDSLRPRA